MSVRKLLWRGGSVLLGVIATLTAAVVMLNARGEEPIANPIERPFAATPAQVERGRYLALAGNCAGCHTARGGTAYAGGSGIDTPFGTLFASNLTPDARTGLGLWSPDHFWRALHNGRSRDGRLLYPAFPYTSYTQITREDSDALYAWLRTLPPVEQPTPSNTLRFPYDTQAALAVWRALYFSPATFAPQPQQTAEWNRGAYLVEGLGHCIACHGSRNALGATNMARGLVGGTLPDGAWYAPALDSTSEAGVSGWSKEEVVALLKTGRNGRASASGPMAEVVHGSTQHLSESDLGAIAVFLGSLPPQSIDTVRPPEPPSASQMRRGEKVYAQQCAWCHGEQGEGEPGVFPPLAGNRAVSLHNPTNLIQMVRRGGYSPATEGNPRPYGMPPFGHVLGDEDIAAVLTFVRASWGNQAPEVTLRDAMRR